MKRYTFRTGKRTYISKAYDVCAANRPIAERMFCVNCHCTKDRSKCMPLLIIDRLAAYEDTGLEPEEIDSIFVNSVLEENKRLKAEIANLRGQRNPPLTLEELREMDGEPVWVTQPDEILPPFWGLVDARDGTVSGVIYCGTFEDYGEEWLAYRRKPEEWET